MQTCFYSFTFTHTHSKTLEKVYIFSTSIEYSFFDWTVNFAYCIQIIQIITSPKECGGRAHADVHRHTLTIVNANKRTTRFNEDYVIFCVMEKIDTRDSGKKCAQRHRWWRRRRRLQRRNKYNNTDTMHRKEEKWNKARRRRVCEWRGVCSVYFIRVYSRIWAMNLWYETLIIFLSDELKWNHRWAPMCITNPTNPLFFRVFFASLLLLLPLLILYFMFIRLLDFMHI